MNKQLNMQQMQKHLIKFLSGLPNLRLRFSVLWLLIRKDLCSLDSALSFYQITFLKFALRFCIEKYIEKSKLTHFFAKIVTSSKRQ